MTLQQLYRDICSSNAFSIETPAGELVDCRDFAALVERCRARIFSAGVASGDAVVFHGDQGLPAIVVFWAAVLEGAVFVPVDSGWPTYLLDKACGKIRPALAIVEDSLLPAWKGLPSAPVIIPVSMFDLEKLPDGAARILAALEFDQDVDCDQEAGVGDFSEAPAAYLFTSGSTGVPKAVVLSHTALALSARRVMESFDWQVGERLLNLADPHTMSGLRNAFIAAPLAGMTWICAPKAMRENAFALIDCIERVRPQRMVAAPVLLRHVNLIGARIADGVFAPIRAVYCTGTDLNVEEANRFHARFGVPVVNYYGLTETVGLCLGQDVRHWSAGDSSIGRPVGCLIRIVDEQGIEVAEGDVGELQVLLEHPMSGYLHDTEATAAMFDGRWLRTGDLVQRDADGRVRIVGRSGSFIKTLNTEKIQPQEIEAVLEQCPGVAEAAVFGWADPAGGERIAALYTTSLCADGQDMSDERLAGFVRDRLGAMRVPTVFRRVAAIPRSANGKIFRKKLAELI